MNKENWKVKGSEVWAAAVAFTPQTKPPATKAVEF